MFSNSITVNAAVTLTIRTLPLCIKNWNAGRFWSLVPCAGFTLGAMFALLFTLTTTATAQPSSPPDPFAGCAGVLTLGEDTVELTKKDSIHAAFRDFVFNSTEKQLKAALKAKVDMVVPISGVPLPIKAEKDVDMWVTQRQTLNRETTWQINESSFVESLYKVANSATTKAIDAWLACIDTTAGTTGLRVLHSRVDDEIIIRVKWTLPNGLDNRLAVQSISASNAEPALMDTPQEMKPGTTAVFRFRRNDPKKPVSIIVRTDRGEDVTSIPGEGTGTRTRSVLRVNFLRVDYVKLPGLSGGGAAPLMVYFEGRSSLGNPAVRTDSKAFHVSTSDGLSTEGVRIAETGSAAFANAWLDIPLKNEPHEYVLLVGHWRTEGVGMPNFMPTEPVWLAADAIEPNKPVTVFGQHSAGPGYGSTTWQLRLRRLELPTE